MRLNPLFLTLVTTAHIAALLLAGCGAAPHTAHEAVHEAGLGRGMVIPWPPTAAQMPVLVAHPGEGSGS